MTSLFFGKKKDEKVPKDTKDPKKDAPAVVAPEKPKEDPSKVKVSAKDALIKEASEKKDKEKKEEKKDKKKDKDKEKEKHKAPEEGMPEDEATLNAMFMALLDSLEFAEKEREAMMKQSKETKWMYIKNQKASATTGNVNETPAYFCSSLQASPSRELLHSLRLVMQSKPIAWIKQFRDLEGIRHLTHYMSVLDKKGSKCTPEEIEGMAECARIMKALMNNKVGLEGLLNTPHSIRPLCGTLHHPDVQVVRLVHQLLLVVLIHGQDGYKLLVDALQHYGQLHGQKRFQVLIDTFTKGGLPLEAQAVLFSLIYRLITNPTEIDFRVSLSTEFNRLGLKELIEKLKKQPNYENSDLENLIDDYEEDIKSDAEELQARFRDLNVDLNDAMKIAERLNNQLAPTPAQSSFLGVLRELLGVPGTTDAGLKAWILIERLITQISLQKSVLHIDGDNAVVLADLFASVEAAAKQQTGNKKVDELEKLVAKLERFESQREAEIRQKDATINELRTQIGDAPQLRAALEAAQREVEHLKKEAADVASRVKSGQFTPAAAGGETPGGDAAPAEAAPVAVANPGAPPPPKPPAPPKGLKLKPKPAAVADAAPADGAPAETPAPAPAEGGEAAAAPTGGPPPPPPPKMKGPPPPPPPKLKGKAAPTPAPAAEGGDATAPAEGAAADAPAESSGGGGPPPPGPPPPPGKGGPPPPPMKGGPPPPPGKGGPPPPPGKGGPPPPPGGKKSAAVAAAAAPPIPPKKRPPPPTVKMKGITWNKVPPNKLAQTVWAKTSDFEVAIDQRHLEELFGAAVVEAKKPDDANKKKKKEPVSLIDGKKAQNLNILLGSKLGKLSFEDVKRAILTLDESVLVQEVTKALLGFVPTDEEITQMTEFVKEQEAKPDPEDRLPLAKADSFLLEMHKIPHLQERLASLLYKLNFPVKFEEIRPDIRSLKIACQELRRSEKMVKLLEVILYLGNFLNAGTFRGNMDGVKVDMLPKLIDTKTNSKEMPTFLHYLVVFIADKLPDLNKWPEEITYSTPASKVSLPTAEAEIAQLKKGLAALETALTKVDSVDEKDAFKRVMAEFAERAKREFGELEALLKETQDSFVDVLNYFGEDPKTSPEDFFRVWATFSQLWDKAREDNKKAEETREKLKKREEQEKKKKEAAAAKGEKKGAGGLVDDLMSNLGKVKRPTQRNLRAAMTEATDGAHPEGAHADGAHPDGAHADDEHKEPHPPHEHKEQDKEAKEAGGEAAHKAPEGGSEPAKDAPPPRSASPQRTRSSDQPAPPRSVSPQRGSTGVPPLSPRGLGPRVIPEGAPPQLSPRGRASASGEPAFTIGSRGSAPGEPKPLPAKPKAHAKQGGAPGGAPDAADEAGALFANLKKGAAKKAPASKPAAPDIADEALALFANVKKAAAKKPAGARLSIQSETPLGAPPPQESSGATAPPAADGTADAKPPPATEAPAEAK